MDKTINQSSGPKVSQIANLFQRRPTDMDSMQSDQLKDAQHQHHHQQQQTQQQSQSAATVVRTESHSTRFNNARALFEKLGVENRAPRPAALSLKMSNSSSREDNLGDLSPDRDNMRTPSPKRTKYPIGNNNNINSNNNNNNNIVNGVPKRDPTKIHNTSRLKSDKPEKPEKPERKFNSKELIEKQKNWTSHFTKARTTRFNSDPNRCDIIRSVPGTVFYPASGGGGSVDNSLPTSHQPNSLESMRYHSSSKSVDYAASASPHQNSPPSPPIRQHLPPEIKPRHTKLPSSICSPTKPPPPIPTNKPQIVSPIKSTSTYSDHQNIYKATNSINTNKHNELPEKRKRSVDMIDDVSDCAPPVEYAQVKKHSITTSADISLVSPAHGVSSSPSPAPSASSGPSSPIHTEDEKQENESTEKSEKPSSPPPEPFERKSFLNYKLLFLFFEICQWMFKLLNIFS